MNYLPATLLRIFSLTLLWWILTGGQFRDPVIAAGVILAAAILSLRIQPPQPGTIRWSRWLAFAPWFLKQSILGGFDVAMRALRLPVRIEPVRVRYQPELGESGTLLFMWTVSLLPGTACVHRHDKDLVIHFLQRTDDPELQLDQLRTRIAALFEERERLPGSSGEV